MQYPGGSAIASDKNKTETKRDVSNAKGSGYWGDYDDRSATNRTSLGRSVAKLKEFCYFLYGPCKTFFQQPTLVQLYFISCVCQIKGRKGFAIIKTNGCSIKKKLPILF